jgi:hypothetical protein
VANLLGLSLIVLTNEIAGRRDREAVIAIVMTLSGLLGLTLALAAPLSPIATISAAILFLRRRNSGLGHHQYWALCRH